MFSRPVFALIGIFLAAFVVISIQKSRQAPSGAGMGAMAVSPDAPDVQIDAAYQRLRRFCEQIAR